MFDASEVVGARNRRLWCPIHTTPLKRDRHTPVCESEAPRGTLPKAGEVECNDIDDDDARTHICMMVGGSVIGRVGGAGGGERMRVCTHAGIWTRAAVSRRVRGAAGIFSTAGEGTYMYVHTSRVQHAFGSFIQVAGSIRINRKDTMCTKDTVHKERRKP